MSMIMVRGGFNSWPDLIQFLTDNLNTADATVCENSVHAISIVVEDCTSLFEQEEYVTLIEYMIKPIFNLLHPDAQRSSTIKAHAINIINLLLLTGCSSVKQYT